LQFSIPAGQTGLTGPANTLSIGMVGSGVTPAVWITGETPNQVLNLTLPYGPQGVPGPGNSLSIGTVGSGAVASATVTGESPNQVLNLTLPQGQQGIQGEQGIQGQQGPPGVPNSFNEFFVFGDSIGTMSTPSGGAQIISNGAPYPAIIAKTAGFNPWGRWIFQGPWSSGAVYNPGTIVTNGGSSWLAVAFSLGATPATDTGANWIKYTGVGASGYTTSTGWNNYAVSGAQWSGATLGEVNTQVSQWLTDYSSGAPSGSIVHFEWTFGNDLFGISNNSGMGMVNNTDPLGVTCPSFTQPAVNSSVTVTLSAIPTGMVANATAADSTWVWVPNGGVYSVSAINGDNVTLVNQGATLETTSAAPGATVTGGNIRWAAAQYIDDILSSFVTAINAIIAKGVEVITVSTCPDVSRWPTESAVPNAAATATWYNAKLRAAVASIPQVHVFDLASIYTSIFANPTAYGVVGLDGPTSSSNPIDILYFYPNSNIHPTATGHKILASAYANFLIQLFAAGVITPSLQQMTQFSLLNSQFAGPTPAFASSAAGWTPTTPVVPQNITAADPRINNSAWITQPLQLFRVFEDYDGGLVTGTALPDSSWTADAAGSGAGSIVNPVLENAYGVHGALQATLYSANDRYGQTKTSTPFLYGVNGQLGPIQFLCRLAGVFSSTDQVIYRGGFVDAIGANRPQNGVFLEIEFNSGTTTANLIVANAGSYTLMPFTYTWPNSTTAKGLTFWSDYDLLRWTVTSAGSVLLSQAKAPALPMAALFLAHQFVKPTAGAGISYAMTDCIGGILEVSRF
jgi:phospholipase/lecithinase/hemolysin